jgi:hypothetical protein
MLIMGPWDALCGEVLELFCNRITIQCSDASSGTSKEKTRWESMERDVSSNAAKPRQLLPCMWISNVSVTTPSHISNVNRSIDSIASFENSDKATCISSETAANPVKL